MRAASETWDHLLLLCPLYNDVRNLDELGIVNEIIMQVNEVLQALRNGMNA